MEMPKSEVEKALTHPTTKEGNAMKPREIRHYILTDHAFLRGMLDELDQRAFRVLEGREEELPTLRDYGLLFHSKFAEHLDFEDRFLAPALRTAGLAGIDHAKHLADDHREQRELLNYIVSGLRDRSRPAQVVAGELRSLVELILDDMAMEEMTIIKSAVLRDPDLRPNPPHTFGAPLDPV
jgi:iron-sulfur cluster repair protein YtfE (RIC family)